MACATPAAHRPRANVPAALPCLAHAGAGDAGVLVLAGVAAAGLLAWVVVGAGRPVVGVALGAGCHLHRCRAGRHGEWRVMPSDGASAPRTRRRSGKSATALAARPRRRRRRGPGPTQYLVFPHHVLRLLVVTGIHVVGEQFLRRAHPDSGRASRAGRGFAGVTGRAGRGGQVKVIKSCGCGFWRTRGETGRVCAT